MARFINLHLLNFDILVQDLICREASSVTRLNSRSPGCQPHWRLLWVVVLYSIMSFQEFMIAALAAIA
jgi:hypothetical protein